MRQFPFVIHRGEMIFSTFTSSIVYIGLCYFHSYSYKIYILRFHIASIFLISSILTWSNIHIGTRLQGLAPKTNLKGSYGSSIVPPRCNLTLRVILNSCALKMIFPLIYCVCAKITTPCSMLT